MNPKKVLLIVGGLLVLGMTLLIMQNLSSKDTTRPTIDTIMSTNAAIIGLSGQASQNASVYEVQTAAATLLATTTSDNKSLQTYYKERYGKESKLTESKTVVEELKNTAPGSSYDNKYKQLVSQYLKTNQNNMQNVYNRAKSQQLKDLLSTIYNNQDSALKSLESL